MWSNHFIHSLDWDGRHDIHHMRSLIVIVLAFACVTASSATLTGRTVRVTDGDTLVILSEGNVQHKIRLQGIDAHLNGVRRMGQSQRIISRSGSLAASLLSKQINEIAMVGL